MGNFRFIWLGENIFFEGTAQHNQQYLGRGNGGLSTFNSLRSSDEYMRQ